MSKSNLLKPIFTDKHKGYMTKALHSTISVAEGSVRAGKTVDNVFVFAEMLRRGVPDRIHLATGSTSANAKLNIGDCNGFGLEYIFRGRCRWTKYKGNDALLINTSGRQYVVIFAGGGKADSFKKIRGNSYGMWIATEINLHHENTIKEAFNRQLASKVRRILWDLNPSSPTSFIYKNYIDGFAESYGEKYNYGHFTIKDNASISEKRIAEIESQYDQGTIWYKRDILGLRCASEGLVYDMFTDDNLTDDDIDTIGDWYISSDYGIQNATVFLPFRKVVDSTKWYCPTECYYSGRDAHKQKTVSELVDMLEDMVLWLRDAMQWGHPKQLIVDPSASALIVELRKRGYKVRQADNDVLPGIADVCSMVSQNDLVFNRHRCKETIGEYGLYAWDSKASEMGEDKPIKENDHCMDAVRYFVRTNKLVRKNIVTTRSIGTNLFL